MAIALEAEIPPIRLDESGALRIGSSNVLLEMVIGSFKRGALPEQIVMEFPSADLGDVYSTVAYYLRHTDDVEGYLRSREKAAAEIRSQIAAAQPEMTSIRKRLIARRAS